MGNEWEEECLFWRGRILTGEYRHWCMDYDQLPVDETCTHEWPCECAPDINPLPKGAKFSREGISIPPVRF